MSVIVAESADDFFALLASIDEHAVVAWDRDVPSLPECRFVVVTFDLGDAGGRVYVQPLAGADFDGFTIYELQLVSLKKNALGVRWVALGQRLVRLADSAAARQVAAKVAALRASRANAGELVNNFADEDEEEDGEIEVRNGSGQD